MINISQQIYVGWDSTGVYNMLPEAEVIPLGESALEKKKLTSFVIKHNKLQEYDNIPLPGFTLHQVNKLKYNSPDSSWLVIDPRGFFVRISQENMQNILEVTGITEGLIQQKCIWARENSDVKLSLVPISSLLYAEAVNNTKLIESKVDINDVSIGDTVLLQNKIQGVYLGVQSLYTNPVGYGDTADLKIRSLLRKQIVEIAAGKFYYQNDVNILKVIKKCETPTSREEVSQYLNNQIQHNSLAYFTPYNFFKNVGYYPSDNRIKYASTYAAPKVNFQLVEINQQEAKDIYVNSVANRDHGILVLEKENGDKFILDFPWWRSISLVAPVSEIHLIKVFSISEDRISISDNVRAEDKKRILSKEDSLDKFCKFYKTLKFTKKFTYI